MSHARGFTLIEVLVALAVLALAAAAILRQTQQGIDQQRRLEEKSVALWLADDQLAQLGAASDWPPLGRATQRRSLAGQHWQVATEVQATAMPELRRVTVTVRAGEDRQAPALAELTTFRGRY